MTIKMINRQRLWCAAVAVVFALSTQIALADTLLVPSGYSTIQAAIDAADPGDVVEIADGTYTGVGNKDLDFGGKAITVRSASGDPNRCIIDCEEDGRGFYFHNGEGEDSVVEGMTITNGSEVNGGAIRCFSSSPTIRECIIRGNTATSTGGGVYCQESNVALTRCEINANSGNYTGGIYCVDSNISLDYCTLTENSDLSNFYTLYFERSDGTIINCLVANNLTGGIYCRSGSPAFTNCTIAGNVSGDLGGGLRCWSNGAPTLDNCILWGNSPLEIFFVQDPPVLSYCCVQGGAGEPWFGVGCIDSDPLFPLPGNYRLKLGSPCIDSGTNSPSGGLPSTDLDGNPRPLDGDGDAVAVADIGAYEWDSMALPMIGVGDSALEFFATVGADAPADQVLLVANVGGGILNWAITWDAEWLTVSPSAGDSTGEVDQVTVSVDIDGLLPGAHTVVFEVADAGAVNSPVEVSVTLYVGVVRNVPGTYPTIQAAIDAAVDGDVVEIADGTYTGFGNKALDFGGKSITVRSASGDPDLCTIDCENDGRGFHFNSGEDENSTVEGLTIANGAVAYGSEGGTSGGGVRCYESSPMLVNCTLRDNSASGTGGGLWCYAGSPKLVDCAIIGNDASSGGGVSCSSGAVTLTDCILSENSASSHGGGFNCSSGVPSLAGCILSGNTCSISGGGAYFYKGGPTFTDCTITGNTAYDSGGGCGCDEYAAATLTRCTISGNNTSGDGGGVWCRSLDAKFENCTISGNTSSDEGGGFHCYNGNPVLTNCTFSGNIASTRGGGVSWRSSINPRISNCILWGDSPNELVLYYTGREVTYCCIQGGSGESWFGEGCIDLDPLFLLAGDYHLKPGSPCIDSGTNSPFGGLPAYDLEGNPRLLDGDGDEIAIADMGAYEVDPAAIPGIGVSDTELVFIVPEGTNGTSEQNLLIANTGGGVLNWEVTWEAEWLSASPSTGESSGEEDPVALSVDVDGLTHGEYSAVLEVSDPLASNSPVVVAVTLFVCDTLEVPSDYATIQAAIDAAVDGDVVEIADGTYTGPGNKNLDFGGKAITVRSASGDPDLCIIDCERLGRGFYFHSGEGADSIVEGLTITRGRGDEGMPSGPRGGAVYCDFSNPTLLNCSLIYNGAEYGGGVHCGVTSGGNSAPRLVNCAISNNVVGLDGGGIYGSAILTNCTINDNHADWYGGGICYGNATLTNCTLSGNVAYHDGGAVYGRQTLTNCVVHGNGSNAIFEFTGSITATYCNIEGGTGESWFGLGCIDADPLFVDPDGPDNDPDTWEDNDYRLLSGSPCIDAGNNSALPVDTFDLDGDGNTTELLPIDLDGFSRFVDDLGTTDTGVGTPPIVDMGAYELHGAIGDFNGDEVVDLDDFDVFYTCMTGPGGVASGACQVCDLDLDNDVDLADFIVLQRALGAQ